MEFRRSGQRDDRRRRVFREDREDLESRSPEQAKQGRHRQSELMSRIYSRQARRRFQMRTVDLLPKRRWWLATVVAVMLAICAGFGWLEVCLQPIAGKSALAAHFLPSHPGGLDAWFATCMMLASTAVAIQILLLRRFRSNDYRGSYQIWSWLAVACLLASLETSAQLTVGLDLLLANQWRPSLGSREFNWSLIITCLLGSLFFIRVGLELRHSRAAWPLLAASLIAFVIGGAGSHVNTNEISERLPFAQQSLAGTFPTTAFILAGQCLLLSSLLAFARCVYMDAHGILPYRLGRRSTVRRRALAIRRLRRIRVRREREQELAAKTEHSGDSSENTTTPARQRRKTTKRTRNADTSPAEQEESVSLKVARGTENDSAESLESKSQSSAPSKASRPQVARDTLDAEPKRRSRSSENREPLEQARESENDESLQFDEGVDGPDTLKLSKAERRRQRKAAKRSQRRAA